MCGRFTLRSPTPVLMRHFGLASAPELAPRYNIAPTQSIPVVRQQKGGDRELAQLHWGLIPSWAKDTKSGARLINARGETVADKPSFRAAFKRRRCLVIADGYLEWLRAGKEKKPYFIRMNDEGPFAMAGLWEIWRGGNKSETAPTIQSCTIITTDANDLTREIHDRMPVVLDAEDWPLWLNPDMQEPTEIKHLLRPYDSGAMKMDAVSQRVNSVRNDDPDCLVIQKELF